MSYESLDSEERLLNINTFFLIILINLCKGPTLENIQFYT